MNPEREDMMQNELYCTRYNLINGKV